MPIFPIVNCGNGGGVAIINLNSSGAYTTTGFVANYNSGAGFYQYTSGATTYNMYVPTI